MTSGLSAVNALMFALYHRDVHGGALGWNGFMAAGMLYWMIPKLYGTKLHSTRLADLHFWIGTFGILLYVIAMWVSGVTTRKNSSQACTIRPGSSRRNASASGRVVGVNTVIVVWPPPPSGRQRSPVRRQAPTCRPSPRKS